MIYEDYVFPELFKKEKKRSLTIVRGDTFSFAIKLLGLIAPPESVYFSCSEKNSDSYIFSKSIGDGIDAPTYQPVKDVNDLVQGIIHERYELSPDIIYYLKDTHKMMYWASPGESNLRFEYIDKIPYKIWVGPGDTKEATPGEYSWDLQVGGDGDIFTIAGGTLTILPEATTI